ncbi:FTR1 family iron permease [Castellaniella sp.]|uniref:FTR1 family iron permease n=1 Tax=Castellaniella sp. TaxID=1955812 RepID=UPI002AFE3E6D|nr:FTR1 family protein [Castellaniella sp.]
MEQVAFIVWRESVEALLVVGILYAWLRASPEGRRGLPWLWGGVGAGLLLAGALALVLLGVASWLSDTGQEWFQIIMALVACALVVQMVIWMRQHGRSLRRQLETGAAQNLGGDHWWGLLVLVMIAVAREGSETVVFLYGTVLSASDGNALGGLLLAGFGGFVAALFTFWLLQLGGRVITWRRFFRLTEILLLLLAGALLVSATDRLISLDILPALMDPVWDSSSLLDTQTTLGRVLADFAGYRAYPALSQVLIWLAYWGVVWWLLRRASSSVPGTTAAARVQVAPQKSSF